MKYNSLTSNQPLYAVTKSTRNSHSRPGTQIIEPFGRQSLPLFEGQAEPESHSLTLTDRSKRCFRPNPEMKTWLQGKMKTRHSTCSLLQTSVFFDLCACWISLSWSLLKLRNHRMNRPNLPQAVLPEKLLVSQVNHNNATVYVLRLNSSSPPRPDSCRKRWNIQAAGLEPGVSV